VANVSVLNSVADRVGAIGLAQMVSVMPDPSRFGHAGNNSDQEQ
jgi:hypothetical protein